MKPYIITMLGYKSQYLGDPETETGDRKDTDFTWEVNHQTVVYGQSPEEAVNRYVQVTKYVGTFLVISPTETETQVVLVGDKSDGQVSGDVETPNNVAQ